VLLFIGALFCARAAQPVDFFIAGYEPKRMTSAAQDETWIFRYAAEDVQARIDANRDSLVRASWWLIWGQKDSPAWSVIRPHGFFRSLFPGESSLLRNGTLGSGRGGRESG
jgi:hypothetical protein